MRYWVLESIGENAAAKVHRDDCECLDHLDASSRLHGEFDSVEGALIFARSMFANAMLCSCCGQAPDSMDDAVFSEQTIDAQLFSESPAEEQKTFWIFESKGDTHFATIHTHDCMFCNNGEGVQGQASGQWHGSFPFYGKAREFAQTLECEIYNCRKCRPKRFAAIRHKDSTSINTPPQSYQVIITKAVFKKGDIEKSDSTNEKLIDAVSQVSGMPNAAGSGSSAITEDQAAQKNVENEAEKDDDKIQDREAHSQADEPSSASAPSGHEEAESIIEIIPEKAEIITEPMAPFVDSRKLDDTFCVVERKSIHYSATIHRSSCSVKNPSAIDSNQLDSTNIQKITVHEGFRTYDEACAFVNGLNKCELRVCRVCEPSKDVVSMSSIISNQPLLRKFGRLPWMLAAITILATLIVLIARSCSSGDSDRPIVTQAPSEFNVSPHPETELPTQIPSPTAATVPSITVPITTSPATSSPPATASTSPEPTTEITQTPEITPSPSPVEVPTPPAELVKPEYETTKINVATARGRVHMRENATSRSRSIGVIQKNSALLVLSRGSQWSKVYQGGKIGYASSNFISAEGDELDTYMPASEPSFLGMISEISMSSVALEGQQVIPVAPNATLAQVKDGRILPLDFETSVGADAMLWTDESGQIIAVLAL